MRATRAPSLMAIQQNEAGLSGPVPSAGCPKAKNAITAISFYLQPLVVLISKIGKKEVGMRKMNRIVNSIKGNHEY